MADRKLLKQSYWLYYCRIYEPDSITPCPFGGGELRADATVADHHAYVVRALSVLLGGLGFKI